MLGKLLNTLSYRVKQEEKVWKSKSELRKEYSYGKFRSILIFLSRKPAKWSAFIFTFFILLSLLVNLPVIVKIIPTPYDFNTSELISYYSTLWSVQATIAALIYPIVIAFVSLLLQRRHSAKSYLNIYLHDTAALLSGLCAISLIFLMGIQYFLIPNVPVSVSLNWLYVDALFFLMNLILSSFFLYQTFEYLKPAERQESFKKYLINEIWPQEFKSLLSPVLFRNALGENLIKTKDIDNNINDDKLPSVWTGEVYSYFGGERIVDKKLPNNSKLLDVRFRWLSWATSLWRRKIKFQMNDKFVLIYPLLPGKTYSDNTAICKVQGPIKPTILQKLLIRWSFKFKKKKKEKKSQVSDLLDDLSAEALRALRSGEAQTFSEALDDLLEFIIILIKASAFRDAGKLNNYSIISSGSSFLYKHAYQEWLEKVSQIFEPAAERIISDDSYIAHLIYSPKLLFIATNEQSDIKIQEELLSMYKTLNYRIGEWWVKTIENQGTMKHDKCNPALLMPPYRGTYENILRSFIGHWEMLRKDHLLASRKEQDHKWELLQEKKSLFTSHLNISCQMLIHALNSGDESRTKYFLDSLLKWHSGLRARLDNTADSLIDNSSIINLDTLEQPWNEIENEFDFHMAEWGTHKPPNLIFSIAIKNYWIDLCCILMYNFCKEAKHCKEIDESLAIDAYKAIFYGRHPIQGENFVLSNEKPLQDINNLFQAILRQFFSGFIPNHQYKAKLSYIIEHLFPRNWPSVIPGRVYSGSGREDLDSLRDGILLTLTLLVTENWNPVQKFESSINEWLKSNLQQTDYLSRTFQDWMNRLEDENFNQYKPVYEVISEGNRIDFEASKAIVANSLKAFVEKVEAIQLELIKSLDIDANKLIQIEEWCSEQPFNKNTGRFPIPLFKNIDLVDEELVKKELNFSDCKKGWLTSPKMSLGEPQRNFFKNFLNDNVSYYIWNEIINKLQIEEIEIDTAESFWNSIKEFKETIIPKGKTPILIINNEFDPRWVHDWTTPYRRKEREIPNDLNFSKKEKIKTDYYIGNFNETEIYSVNGLLERGNAYLLTKEVFESLKFSRNEHENLVTVTPQKKEHDPKLVDLLFSWQFDVISEPDTTLLLKFHENDKE